MIIYKSDIVAYIDIRDNRTSTAEVITKYTKLHKIKLETGMVNANTLLVINHHGEEFLILCGTSQERLIQSLNDDGYLMF